VLLNSFAKKIEYVIGVAKLTTILLLSLLSSGISFYLTNNISTLIDSYLIS
jgi:hypothetical protein